MQNDDHTVEYAHPIQWAINMLILCNVQCAITQAKYYLANKKARCSLNEYIQTGCSLDEYIQKQVLNWWIQTHVFTRWIQTQKTLLDVEQWVSMGEGPIFDRKHHFSAGSMELSNKMKDSRQVANTMYLKRLQTSRMSFNTISNSNYLKITMVSLQMNQCTQAC